MHIESVGYIFYMFAIGHALHVVVFYLPLFCVRGCLVFGSAIRCVV